MNPSDIKSRLETCARSPGEVSDMFITKTFAEALIYIMDKLHPLYSAEEERRKAKNQHPGFQKD
jgi:hypothetical protein